MKTKNYILFLMAGLCLLASCNDDKDHGYISDCTIRVTASQTALTPDGDGGYIKVDCNPVYAYSDNPSWLSVSITGENIKLSAQPNDSKESRNAKVIIKKDIKDSVVVNVSQYGVVYSMDRQKVTVPNNEAYSTTLTFRANALLTITSVPDGIDARVDNEGKVLSVDFSKNESGHMRGGYLKYKVAALEDSVYVAQYDFDSNIAGEYNLAFYAQDADGKVGMYGVKAVLSRTSLSIPALVWEIPVTFDEGTCSLNMQSNQYVGRFLNTESQVNGYVYTLFLDEDGNGAYGDGSGRISASFRYGVVGSKGEYGTIATFAGLAYQVTSTGQQGNFKYLAFTSYKAKNPSSSNVDVNVSAMANPFLLRIGGS